MSFLNLTLSNIFLFKITHIKEITKEAITIIWDKSITIIIKGLAKPQKFKIFFISNLFNVKESGKIVPKRLNGTCAKHQRSE